MKSSGTALLRGTSELTTDFGGHGGGVTPVPIPNTEVKPSSADGTWDESPWESRTPPDFFRYGTSGSHIVVLTMGCALLTDGQLPGQRTSSR